MCQDSNHKGRPRNLEKGFRVTAFNQATQSLITGGKVMLACLFFSSCAIVTNKETKAIIPIGAKVDLENNRAEFMGPFDVVDKFLDFLAPKTLISSVFEGVAEGLKAFNPNNKK